MKQGQITILNWALTIFCVSAAIMVLTH